MEKKEYIAPSLIAVHLPQQSLMTTVSGFEETTSGTQRNPSNALGKGSWTWDDDEPWEDEIQ